MIKSDILLQIKDCYWITDNKKDQIINLSIKKSLLLLEQSLWCNICKTDDLWVDVIHSQRISKCQLSWKCPTIYTCVPNITELVSIDSQTITWYNIVWKNCIQLPDNCIDTCGCCKVEIKYKWWLIAKDLLNLFIANYEYENSKCEGRTIKKLTMWDKTTEWCNCDDEWVQKIMSQIIKLYKPYKSIHYCTCH